jgi:hypothetical protein
MSEEAKEEANEGDAADEDSNDDEVPFSVPKNVAPVHEVQQFIRLLWIENTAGGKRDHALFLNALFDLVWASLQFNDCRDRSR